MIITVYIDESGTHDEAPHMVLGGWVGKFGQWKDFDKFWKRHLKKNELTFFHSKEMRHSENEFNGWAVDDKRDFMRKAAKRVRRHVLFGFTFYLDKTEFDDVHLGEHTPHDLPLDSQYGVAFRSCLYFVPQIVQEALPGKEIECHFVVEENEYAGGAVEIFRKVKKHAPDEFSSLLGTIAVGEKKKYPGLQIADVNAYNGFRFEGKKTKLRVSDLPRDNVWKAARNRSRCPVFRCVVNEGELEKFKNRVLSRYGNRLDKRKASAAKPS